MKIFSIGDLHLSRIKKKPMEIFGENWKDHDEQIKANWISKIGNDDLVLIPGDISWGMTPEEAMPDLEWISELPGKKVMIKGNHDFWWQSYKQVKELLPQGITAIQNNSIVIDDIAITGTRLWESPDVDFTDDIKWICRESIGLGPEKNNGKDPIKLYNREVQRLNHCLESISSKARKIIVMTHFPPVDFRFELNEVVETLQKFGTDICIFSHLHSLKRENVPSFPVKKYGMNFYLVSSDVIDFDPVEIKI